MNKSAKMDFSFLPNLTQKSNSQLTTPKTSKNNIIDPILGSVIVKLQWKNIFFKNAIS